MNKTQPTAIAAEHECDGRACSKPTKIKRRVTLGCGCTRWECERHDETVGVHFLTGGCSVHEADNLHFYDTAVSA